MPYNNDNNKIIMLMMSMIMWRLHLKPRSYGNIESNSQFTLLRAPSASRLFVFIQFASLLVDSLRWNRWTVSGIISAAKYRNDKRTRSIGFAHTHTLIFHSAGDTRIHLKFPIAMQRSAASQIYGFALAANIIIIIIIIFCVCKSRVFLLIDDFHVLYFLWLLHVAIYRFALRRRY